MCALPEFMDSMSLVYTEPKEGRAQFITASTTVDCKLGEPLINGIDTPDLLADRGYDVNTIIEQA